MLHEKSEDDNRLKLVASIASKRDRLGFVKEVMKLLGGANILECIECGLCAGSCPTRFAMNYSPMQVLKMIRLGMREDVLSSSTIWICSTCHICTARCPRGINLTTLMMSLRNLAITESFVNNDSMEFKFHRSFFEVINKYGRLHELALLTKIIRKTDAKELFHNAVLGWRLLRKGKLRLLPERIEHLAELGRILEKTSEAKIQ